VRKLLVLLGVAWIAVNLYGAWMAVEHKRPYDLSWLDEPGSKDHVGDDWLHGWGTGLAMPFAVVAVVAVLTVIATFGGGAGKFSALLLTVVGGLCLFYTLTNDLTLERLKNTKIEHAELAVVSATLTVSGLLVLFGFLTVITTPKTYRR
jgi:threonine/homoserine/homoserine lactone efflux protein